MIAAGGWSVLEWNDIADNGGDPLHLPSMSCALPPGVELNLMEVYTQVPSP